MKRIFATVVFAWCVGFASATIADPPGSDAAALKLQLMKTTQIVAVMDFPGAPDKFVPDNDPDSLQIVFLAKPEFGPSRVSDDGEVIFLTPNVTSDEQSDLIGKAFDLRVQRRLTAQKPN